MSRLGKHLFGKKIIVGRRILSHNQVFFFRILTGLYNSMITNHNPVLQSLLVGIFLQCHAVYGRIIDALLTSASPTDPYNEFYISR